MNLEARFDLPASPRRRRLLAAFGAAATVAPSSWAADPFPSRPIKLLIPYAAGGVTDIAGRLLAEDMTRTLGQPVVVENRAGAGGTIALEAVSKAAPDGHTIGLANIGPLVISPLLQQARYDPLKDFTLLGTACAYELVMVTRTGFEPGNVRDLIAYAKARPGKVSYASAGSGSIYHLAFEYIKTLTGVDLLHIPYKGDAPALADLLGGQVDIGMLAIQGALPSIKAGKLKVYATTGKSRFRLTPELPTVSDSGLPGFEAYSWSTLVGPPGMSQPVAEHINTAINAALRQPAIVDRFVSQGISPMEGNAASATEFVRTELGKWGRIVREAKISATT